MPRKVITSDTSVTGKHYNRRIAFSAKSAKITISEMTNLEVEIASLLRKYQAKTGRLLTISTAESATGGRIADRLTNVPGSSDYFKGSLIAYSNEVKINVLGVKKETIENYGAVSSQTAIEMVKGPENFSAQIYVFLTPALPDPRALL